MRLLLVLLLTVLPLAPEPARADGALPETGSEQATIGADLAHLDQHARGAERIGRRSPASTAPAEGASRASATSITGPRIAVRWTLLQPARGSSLERGCRVASRGEHVPYFPIAPPVQA